ncbi:MAG TPA: amidohydrolase family protein [Candidatus Limnocylindrales bacterium]
MDLDHPTNADVAAVPLARSEQRPAAVSRRGFLAWSAAMTLAACADAAPTPRSILPTAAAPSPEATPRPASGTPPSSPAPSVTSAPSTAPSRRRILIRDTALAEGRNDRLQVGISLFVENGTIAWIRPADDEGDPGPAEGLEIIDGNGATVVPGLVDCHSHVSMPGGGHWIDRAFDAPAELVRAGEHNGRLMTRAGIRWARDVGSPVGADPVDGRERGLALGLRDRWAAAGGDLPYIRAAGTWLTRRGTLPAGLGVEAGNADELLAAATRQLDDGADLVKLYLDGPDADTSPWSTAEIRRVVDAVHGRGAKVTAHSGRLSGARAGVAGGVDSLEHGFELDDDVARDMAARGTALVSTLTVMRSWQTFARTTTMQRFTGASGRAAIAARLERAEESVRIARAAGVAIAAGTDFGGGSGRANQLAWEVESLVAAELEPWEALGAATWRGGELLGEPDAGVIRVGGPADIVLVHGDPTTDPTALWRVWRVVWSD